MQHTSIFKKHSVPLLAACLILITLEAGFLIYNHRTLSSAREANAKLTQELADVRSTFSAEAHARESRLQEIERAFALSEENSAELSNLLNEEKGRNEEFAEQIHDISGTVGKLDKLSKTDPELLQKYSKVYFLNEHYIPEKVVEIDAAYRFRTEPEYISAAVAPFLNDLLADAKEDGIELLVVSGFRSFDEQKGLKSAYSVQYGSGANAFSADQGYSEHQLGTTVDVTTKVVGGLVTSFESSDAYEWLQDNAHKYGFVLSYPKGNTYYVFEPWHWRFVGEELADDLYDDGKYFYDLDQRELDKYLISIFD